MEHATDWLEHLRTGRVLSDGTVRSYAATLRDFEKRMELSDPAAVQTIHFDRYLSRLALDQIAVSTRRSRIFALKSFFRYLVSRGFLARNPSLEVIPPDEHSEGIDTFTEQEILQIIFEYSRTYAPRGVHENEATYARRLREETTRDLRDPALFALLYTQGLRVAEIATLPASSYYRDGARTPLLRLKGKAAREPILRKVDARVASMLDEYLTVRSRLLGIHPALFAPIAGRRTSARDSISGISQSRVQQILDERIDALGIERRGRKLTPHTFRYSIATHMREQGRDVLEIQRHLRHRDLKTTERYIRQGSSRGADNRVIAMLPWNRRPGLAPREVRP